MTNETPRDEGGDIFGDDTPKAVMLAPEDIELLSDMLATRIAEIESNLRRRGKNAIHEPEKSYLCGLISQMRTVRARLPLPQ